MLMTLLGGCAPEAQGLAPPSRFSFPWSPRHWGGWEGPGLLAFLGRGMSYPTLFENTIHKPLARWFAHGRCQRNGGSLPGMRRSLSTSLAFSLWPAKQSPWLSPNCNGIFQLLSQHCSHWGNEKMGTQRG